MPDASHPTVRAERQRETLRALVSMFEDQRFDVLVARRVLGANWDQRLAKLILDLNLTTATRIGDLVAAGLPGDFNPALMVPWLTKDAQIAAENINGSTREALAKALDDAAKAGVFDILAGSSAEQYAASMATTAANFGAHDAARSAGAKTKTWMGGTSRHGHLNGQTVPIDQNFSNGMAWPGDPAGGAKNLANCKCSVSFD